MNEKMESIEINGVKYIRESDAIIRGITNHVIIIAMGGWIFEGYQDVVSTDKIRLLDANVVRSWRNGRGIGGFCKAEFKNEYKLDAVGPVEFEPANIIAKIDIEW